MQSRAAPGSSASPVWRARFVTYGLLAAMVGTVATGSELWPLSQFELFSGVRTGSGQSWQLVTVDQRGEETVVDLGGLPPHLGLVHHLLPGLRDRPLADQQDTVRLWLEAVGANSPEPVAARIYAVRRTVPAVAGAAAIELDRSEAVEIPLR